MDQRILFFDGVCHVCNYFVDLLLGWDKSGRLKFAPLQGQNADRILGPRLHLRSVVYWRDGQAFEESTAILKLLIDLGGAWKLVSIFFVIPAFIRNGVYRLIARNRYRLFGQRETCRMPTPEESARFLN